MTEPRRSAYTRRPAAEGLVAAVVGVLLLVILLQLSASRCGSSRDDRGRAAPGAARSTSTRPVVPRHSASASGQPSPSARQVGPSGTESIGADRSSSPAPGAGASGSPSPAPAGPPPGSTGTPASVPAGSGSAPAGTGPTPTGAPRTGGGSGLGMRNPTLVVAGILMVFAAAALVLFRARPLTLDSDDSGIS